MSDQDERRDGATLRWNRALARRLNTAMTR